MLVLLKTLSCICTVYIYFLSDDKSATQLRSHLVQTKWRGAQRADYADRLPRASEHPYARSQRAELRKPLRKTLRMPLRQHLREPATQATPQTAVPASARARYASISAGRYAGISASPLRRENTASLATQAERKYRIVNI